MTKKITVKRWISTCVMERVTLDVADDFDLPNALSNDWSPWDTQDLHVDEEVLDVIDAGEWEMDT